MSDQKESLLELAVQAPIAQLGRNDPCYCSSGKKYKSCCLKNNNLLVDSGLSRIEEMEIVVDPLSVEEGGWSILEEQDEKQLAEIYRMLVEDEALLKQKGVKTIWTLQKLQVKYQNSPPIWNHLEQVYRRLEMLKEAEEVAKECFEKFPTYLFIRVGMANRLFEQNELERGFQMLGGVYTLKQLYPTRTVFHISELIAFHFSIFKYFCLTGQIFHAEKQLKMLNEIISSMEIWNHLNVLETAEELFLKAKAVHNVKVGVHELMRQSSRNRRP